MALRLPASLNFFSLKQFLCELKLYVNKFGFKNCQDYKQKKNNISYTLMMFKNDSMGIKT